MIHLLLYGDVDLNLIDGSSIWLASVAEVLGGAEDICVTVLLKTPITRGVVIEGVNELPNVKLVDPWMLAQKDSEIAAILRHKSGRRLLAEEAASILRLLDRANRFDFILIRGIGTATVLADHPDLARRLWVYLTDPLRHASAEKRAELSIIANRCERILCQTEEAVEITASLIERNLREKLLLLPPMVPGLSAGARCLRNSTVPKLGYSGKFSPPYMILEMLDAFELIRMRLPRAEFHIVGDKFHNDPPAHGFVERVTNRLRGTPGVVWHGGVSRAETNAILNSVDVASSWRSACFDENLELSTKILEYAALGIPVLLNPSRIQHRIFGLNYPAYVSNKDEFVDRFVSLVSSIDTYSNISQHVRTIAADYTFESCRNKIVPYLQRNRKFAQNGTGLLSTNSGHSLIKAKDGRRRKILFNGHDLKFLRNIMRHFSDHRLYEIRVDDWKGHDIFDEEQSEKLLKWADIIFCEWCLGNARYFSERKRSNQQLFIRLHHQEMELPYRHQLNWSNVDALLFTNFAHFRRFHFEQPENANRTTVVFCDVDCDVLNQEKLPWAEFNLGLVGINPRRKRPDIAVTILDQVKKADSRFSLFFKTRKPWEYKWLWDRPQERRFFLDFFNSLEESGYRNSVVFDRHDDGMSVWYSKIGFLLSTSDHEGSHQAVAEGMASGCIPIVRNWTGATPLYPPNYIYESVDDAFKLIMSFREPRRYAEASASARAYAREHFHTPRITQQLEMLFEGAKVSELPMSSIALGVANKKNLNHLLK